MSVEFIQFVQSFSNPLLDKFFIALSALGVETFYVIALPFIYWVVSKKAGTQITTLFLFSAWLNGALKDTFTYPRPPADEVRILYQESGGGFGFPSGHAQLSTTFWGSLALFVRRKAFTVFAVILVLLIGFSRIYLGLHFHLDVIGGFLIGAAVLVSGILVSRLFKKIPPALARDLALAIGVPLALGLISGSDHGLKTAGYLAGFLAGVLLDREYLQFSVKATVLRQVVKYVLGIVVMVAVGEGLKYVLPPSAATSFLRYGMMGVWGSLGAPYLFRKLSLEAD